MKRMILVAASLVAWSCSSEKAAPAPPAEPQPAEPARRSMNTDLLKSAPKDALANELITYEPIAGHHFEVKAPQACGKFEPHEKAATKVVCQFTEAGEHEIGLNVCDDAKTYCKPVRYGLTATAPAGFVAEKAGTVLAPPKSAHAPVEGFIINDTAAAVAQAKADGKLLFVHFYGIWCPPCNALEEYVYTQKSFLDATSGMVRVMLDADSDLSWDWKAHFKVGGYPTVVIATAELEEIDRLVGARPVAGVVRWAERAEANREAPIAKLLASNPDATAAAPDVRDRVGSYHYERKEWEAAVKWLDGLATPEPRRKLIDAQQQIAKRDGDDARVTALTQQLVAEFPADVRLSTWVEALIEAKAPGADGLVEPALANLEKWKTSAELADSGYSLSDIWWMEGDLRTAAGDTEKAKAAYRRAAELLGEQAKSSSLTVARGANMERAYALHKAGDNEAAKSLLEELVAAYAEEFSFNYNYAHVLNELSERDKALEYAKKAQQYAYGDNLLRAAHLRAKIEHAMGQSADATKTLDEALASAVVPRSADVRTHGYLKRLRSLRAEVVAEPK